MPSSSNLNISITWICILGPIHFTHKHRSRTSSLRTSSLQHMISQASSKERSVGWGSPSTFWTHKSIWATLIESIASKIIFKILGWSGKIFEKHTLLPRITTSNFMEFSWRETLQNHIGNTWNFTYSKLNCWNLILRTHNTLSSKHAKLRCKGERQVQTRETNKMWPTSHLPLVLQLAHKFRLTACCANSEEHTHFPANLQRENWRERSI